MMGQMKVGKFGSGSIFCIMDWELEFEFFLKPKNCITLYAVAV